MPCNCNSQFDLVMKSLQDMKKDIGDVKTEIGVMKKEVGVVKKEVGVVKKEVGVVKTKCNRIEKEILGITAESEMNAESLMETTTVRHLVEKLAFDMDILTGEINEKANNESKRDKDFESAAKDAHSKFSGAVVEKLNDLKQKYNFMTPKSFQKEFSKFLEDFRSHTEKALMKSGFSSFLIHGMVQEVLGTADSDALYKTHFPAAKCEETSRIIRGRYSHFSLTYATEGNEGTVGGLAEVELRAITEFLTKFKLCEESFAAFQKEVSKKLQPMSKKIRANLSLLERLTEDYREYLARTQGRKKLSAKKEELVEILREQINACDSRFTKVYVERLSWNFNRMSFKKGSLGEFLDREFPYLM